MSERDDRHDDHDDHAPHLDAVTAHVERCFGPVASVLHELVSDHVHLDILLVEPTDDRPWWVLVTCGAGALPMTMPDGVAAPRRAELVMCLDAGWPMDRAAWQDERHYWPIRQLKVLARLPHGTGSWLGAGHTVAADPPAPFAGGVPFCAMAVLELLEPAAQRLRLVDGDELAFYQVVPLHRVELDNKRAGELDLDEAFDDDVLRWVWAERPALTVSQEDANARYDRGRRLVVVAVALLAVTIVVDGAACLVDGAKVPAARVAAGVALLAGVWNGGRISRWLMVALATLGSLAAVALLVRTGLSSWRMIGLAASIPPWLAAAALLVLPADVRLWFAAQRIARDRSRG